MNTFRVLVIDDDIEILTAAKEALTSIPGVALTTKNTVDEALKVLQKEFFHLAIVDLEFKTRPDGTRVFKFLQDERPSCEAMLLTQRLDYLKEIFGLFNPVRPQAVAAINKFDVQPSMKAAVQQRVSRWIGNQVEIHQGEEMLASLTARRQSWSDKRAQPSLEEMDFLLSRVLGQGRYHTSSPHDICRASFEIMTGGRSSSIVVNTRPETASGKQGILVVIKVGPRTDMLAEYERYCRFVRYLLSLDARVELLAFESADTLGAMCYSFAGQSPSAVSSLGDLFLREDERAFAVLQNLFSSESQCWYSVAGPKMAPATYLHEFHSLDTHRFIRLSRQTLLEVINTERGAKLVDGPSSEIEFAGFRIGVPAATLGSGRFQVALPTCIVHGDMNASNLIVAEDNRVIMIDYRHTEFALRCLDFAALECSLRLSSYSKEHSFSTSVEDMTWDRHAWEAAWSGASPDPDVEGPFWSRVSKRLIQHARANFPDLEPSEYAMNCFVWAVRVAKLEQVSHSDRFRLLAWLSFLQGKIISR